MGQEALEVLSSESAPGVTLEIVQYPALRGSGDLAVAERVFFANQADIRLKHIRARLDKGEIQIEPGALYYMRGQLQLEASTQGVKKGFMRSFLSGETLFQSKIRGTGEVYLDPSFGHFVMFNIDNDALIVDKGAFYCASGGLEVSAVLQRNVSSALFGGEGFFQTIIRGSGAVVLVAPVPLEEMVTYELAAGEKLFVDGNFAFMRTESITFRAEKSAKSLFRSLVSGEGLLQTFEGPGMVWIAPTQGIYDELRTQGLSSHTGGSMGTKVNN
ncbi:MAG: AIM24 family protein [Candidatus Competibacteraceae bacterium]|jgi:uncharacterized protein (AIM24 family)|nr:AIM24 family protein [Candidatus Competibacteraceae bacterium]